MGQQQDIEGKEDGSKEASRLSFALPDQFRTIAKYCPLIAAILAPLATLLDIPALTQHWYSQYGEAKPDPVASLALSALSLSFNIIANVLLIIRFSSHNPSWWRHATRWSLIMWLAKTAVAMANLVVFGIFARIGNGYSFSEGFWCSVVGFVDAGIICIVLLIHWFLAFDKAYEDTKEVRTQGRRFMLSVTAFISVLAVQSLVFCKIESWAYSDAIYFSVQTSLTIGYGDFAPSTTAGKVLIFPFSVLTISQLGNEIALIIGFISSRGDDRRQRWRNRYEGAMHREANILRPRASLVEEMALIHQINNREEMLSQMYDLLWSTIALVSFWIVGAGIFSSIEGWTYGNALYAVMILSLTIGFGDYTPVQPAGKVIFIVYALLAVPIVTSFAVQTITGLLSTYYERGAIKEHFKSEKERNEKAFAPHSDLVLEARESYGDSRKRLVHEDSTQTAEPQSDRQGPDGEDPSMSSSKTRNMSRPSAKQLDGAEEEVDSEGTVAESMTHHDGEDSRPERKDDRLSVSKPAVGNSRRLDDDDQVIGDDQDRAEALVERTRRTESSTRGANGEDMTEERQLVLDLVKQLVDRAIRLEAEGRQMLLDSMPNEVARTLLLADRNVQIRDVRQLRGDDANMLAFWRGEEEEKSAKERKNQQDAAKSTEIGILTRVRRYRSTFAEILVIGSILQKFEGDELNQFERLRTETQEEQIEEDQEEREDLVQVADERYDGITGKMFRYHAKQLRRKDLRADEKRNRSPV